MWYYCHEPYEIIIFGQLWTRITLKKLKPNKYQIYQALLNCLKPKLLPTPRYCCKESQREPYCFPHVWAVILCDELWPGSLGGGTCESYTTMPGYLQYLHYPGHWSFRDTSNTSHCNKHRGRRRRAHTAGSFRYVLPDYLSLEKIGIDCVHYLGL